MINFTVVISSNIHCLLTVCHMVYNLGIWLIENEQSPMPVTTVGRGILSLQQCTVTVYI